MTPAPLALPVSTSRWFRPVALGLTALLVVVGVVGTFVGAAPWYFLAVFGVAITVMLAPRFGWGRAAWGAVGVALFVASWVLVIDPFVGIRLDVATMAVLVAITAVVLVFAWRRSTRSPYRLPGVAVIDSLVVAAPAVLSAVALVVVALRRGMPLTWAMLGDAQFNTVLSRFVGEGNGETASNVQILSLAQGLMAIVHLPGRDAVASTGLLTHDIIRQADLWLLMILLSSVLAGSLAKHVLRNAPRPLRYTVILGAALLPLSWHMTGYAMNSGFYNVSLTFLVIELGMYFFLVTGSSPIWGSAIGLGLTVVMLGAWTPTAVITLAWAAWSALLAFRRGRPSLWLLVIWTLAVLQFVVFVAAWMLPSFLSKGSLLTHDGTIVPIAQNLFVSVVAGAVLVSLAVWAVHSSRGPAPTEHRHFGVGLALLALSSAAGTALLVAQNRHLPQPWIYYPIKFAWVSMEMIVLVVWIAACLVVSELAGRKVLASIATVTATAVLLISVLQSNPPPLSGFASYFPLASLAKNESPLEPTLPLLSSVANRKIFFSRYLSDQQDTFMNQWQFQLTAKDEFTPIRGYAYRVVESLSDVCGAAEAWGGGVEVITRDQRWANVLNSACGGLLTAVVRDTAGLTRGPATTE